MSVLLAQLVAEANIHRLSLIGLSKNVGKTTTTNHLLETLVSKKFYRAEELALTSLGLDGEAIDALTGLPKPRYVPEAGLLVATTSDLLRQAENDGARIERLQQLAGRTALGSVVLARILQAAPIIIAGPTLLRDLRNALEQLQALGTRLAIVDGAINRLGAAGPKITDACILCTGASAAATAEHVARRTADVILRLSTQQSKWMNAYRKHVSPVRLSQFALDDSKRTFENFTGVAEPVHEARWIAASMQAQPHSIFVLHGAITEELSRALLAALPKIILSEQAELIVEDATKIFCHSVTLQRLSERGLNIRVAAPIRVLAITANPYTPEYLCSSRQLLDVLAKELPSSRPPIIDVISGFSQG